MRIEFAPPSYLKNFQEKGSLADAQTRYLTIEDFTSFDLSPLSDRERQVFVLMAQGLGKDEIAKNLLISPHTAKNHTAEVLHKLGVASKIELVSRLSPEEAVFLAPPISPDTWDNIFPTEWELLAGMANGMSNEELAVRMKNDPTNPTNRSPQTIKNQVSLILSKLGVINREQAMLAYKALAVGDESTEPKLSGREKEVLELRRNGFSRKEIARRLVVEEGTVRRFLSNVKEKSQIRSRQQSILALSDQEAARSAPEVESFLWNTLTETEWNILEGIEQGLHNTAIAASVKKRLSGKYLSPYLTARTVKDYISVILSKLHVPRREDLLLAYKARRYQQSVKK